MSNLRDSLSEPHADVNRPSTSQTRTPAQPFRSKSLLINKPKEANLISPSKKTQKQSSMMSQKNDSIFAPKTFTNSSINELPAQCQNLSLNNDTDEVDQGDVPVTPKGKNARKKEKKKQLNLQMPAANPASLETQSAGAELPGGYAMQHPQLTSVQEFFMKQIGPLYANTNTRYLENLSHHPQYQYMQSIQVHNRQNCTTTPPNTPMLQVFQRPNSVNIPNSHFLQSESTTPRFLQNMMQHPLLCKSISVEDRTHFKQSNTVQTLYAGASSAQVAQQKGKKSPKKRKKNRKTEENTDVKKFEPYISLEDVEKGLQDNTLIEGVLRINPKQFQHAYVSSTDRMEQDVLLDGVRNRNRALEGDIIIVQLLSDSDIEDDTDILGEKNKSADSKSEENKQRKGKVVYIKEAVHTRTCIGTLKLMPDKNRQKALFVPRDHRVPRLNIPFTSWPDNFYQDAKKYENTLFLAKIIEWFDTRFAVGKIVCNIGQSGDMISETKAILAQTDLDITPYGQEFRDLYPRLDFVIPEEEIKLREDCRKLCLFSIDPSNCRDIDDAVSCRELENGNYEIGVHISDVAHFLIENTPLDEKVADKATTIYMVERAYHMLPDELCMLCSLFPGVDKLAFSVFWEITLDAVVLSHRFSKTVIHSCCQLAYDHAQDILDGKKEAELNFPETYNGFKYDDIYKSIKILGQMAAKLRSNRFEGGALRIDQPKVAFCLNPASGLPDSFWIYESKQSHQLIEEFMLLANMTVAGRIYKDHPKLAFLRCHPPPSGYMLTQLAKALKPMGIDLDISSAGDLHCSLLPYVGPDSADRGKAMVLNMLCAKPMTRAKYFCADGCDDDDFHHYALNVPLYTHFTSPIRRYADVMVHRLLAASLKYRDTPTWEVDKVRMIAAQCNKQKYNAKRAGEMSTELYTLKYIEMHSPLITEAVVVEVREKYIDVIIVAMGLNRRIFFNNDFPGEFRCIKNTAGTKLSKMELIWRATKDLPEVKQLIEVFSILQVEMHQGDDMVKVETKLVRPEEAVHFSQIETTNSIDQKERA